MHACIVCTIRSLGILYSINIIKPDVSSPYAIAIIHHPPHHSTYLLPLLRLSLPLHLHEPPHRPPNSLINAHNSPIPQPHLGLRAAKIPRQTAILHDPPRHIRRLPYTPEQCLHDSSNRHHSIIPHNPHLPLRRISSPTNELPRQARHIPEINRLVVRYVEGFAVHALMVKGC